MIRPTYRIHQVAELLGVSALRLRTWERRYGLVVPHRTASGYRAYTHEDMALLEQVMALTEAGTAISAVIPLLPALRKAMRDDGAPQSAAAVSARRIAAFRAAILDAGARSDQARAEVALDRVFAAMPAVEAFEQVVVPVQREVGARWHDASVSVAQEHLVTHVVRTRLVSRLLASPPPRRARRVICACLGEEAHDIGLLGAALRFAQARFSVTYLGAQTPLGDLLAMLSQRPPQILALSFSRPPAPRVLRTAMAALARALPAKGQIWVGGAGVEAHPALFRSTMAEVVLPPEWPSPLADPLSAAGRGARRARAPRPPASRAAPPRSR